MQGDEREAIGIRQHLALVGKHLPHLVEDDLGEAVTFALAERTIVMSVVEQAQPPDAQVHILALQQRELARDRCEK
ncbi:MAG: hypothetical protein QM766_10500 [Burkholderiaceae bacterium]